MEGQRVAGRFVVERRAGSGGMGAVYRALDLTTGQPVALKVLHTAHREHQADRFEREARLLASLGHPGIVHYVAHGATERGGLYLAMEWLEGQDLQERLEQQGLSLQETMRVALRCADAMAFAHDRGVVHRDIKPSNLFLVDRDIDRLKVIDFGIARAPDVRALTQSGASIGTPGFMAPEQVRGAGEVEPAADVFGLGAVLYECLTGRPAFVAENVLGLIAKLLYEQVPPAATLVDELPRELDELLRRMLDKDPTARPRDGRALLLELRRVSDAVALPSGPRRALSRSAVRASWAAEVTCPACYWTGPQSLPDGSAGRIPVVCAKCGHTFELDASLGDELARDLELATLDTGPRLALDAPHDAPTLDERPDPGAVDLEPSSSGGAELELDWGARAAPAARDAGAGIPPRRPPDGQATSAGAGEPTTKAAEPPGGAEAALVAPRALAPATTTPARPARMARARGPAPPAALGRRALAALLDAVVVYGVQAALWRWWLGGAKARLVAAGAGSAEMQRLGWVAFGLAFALALLSAIYFVVPTAVWGQTLGKRVFGLRVVGVDGDERLGPGRVALREVAGRWLSWLGCGLGFVLAWFDEDHRALHDRLARTRVIDD